MSSERTPISMAERISTAKQKIAARASSDNEFRERLIANPHATIEQEFGLPEGRLKHITLNIVQDQSGEYTISIPPADDVELSDEQLESVAGGFGDEDRPPASEDEPPASEAW